MNKIQKLIEKLCPDGVEELQLNHFANFANNGIDKKFRENEIEVGLLNFKDVFNLQLIKMENISALTTVSKEKLEQVLIKKNDIYITPSSEVKDEIGMSAVIAEDIPNTVYSYHIARVRIMDFERVNPFFLSYLFSSSGIREQINQISQGITRYGLTKPMWENLIFPIPPLEIQNEIVKILDNFSLLEAELKVKIEMELEARKKQYSFYRFKLVDNNKSKTVKLKDITEATFWIMPSTPVYDESESIAYITSKNLSKGSIDYKGSKKISKESYLEITKNRPIKEDDLLIGMIGTIGEIARVKKSDLPFYGQNMYLVRFDQNEIDIKYFLHYFDSELMKDYFNSIKNNSAQGYLKAENIDEILIPLPPLSKQKEIAAVLDKYSDLINDISVGLPAEMVARRKQYEYYRDMLLTFKELESA